MSERDRPWLRDLLAFARLADGRPYAELERAVATLPPDPRAGLAFAPVRRLLLHELQPRSRRDGRLVRVREELFATASRDGVEVALARAQRELEIGDGDLSRHLFVDLPSRGTVVWPAELTAMRLALAANRAQVKGLLATADTARLRLHGASRAVLRTAWLLGAGLKLHRAPGNPLDDVVLDWEAGDGEQRRLRRRGLQALVPVLPWARRYALEVGLAARRPGRKEDLRLRLGSLDPVLPGPEPRTYDSRLESALARDLARTASGIEVVREPAPLVVGARLAFPDFAVRLPSRAPWFVEIAGLRDAEAVADKLALLSACERIVLCLPERAAAAIPAHPRLLPFARCVDAARLIRLLQSLEG